MLASITPLGERSRGRRWGSTIAIYLLGSLAGGLAIGALAGLAGSLLPDSLGTGARLLILAAGVLVGLAMDAHLFGLSIPGVKRQVNEDWLVRYRGWVVGLGFGGQLGFGVVTIVTTSAIYAMVLAATLTGDVGTAALIGAVFGVARAAVVFTVAGVRRPEQLGRIDLELRRWNGRTRTGAYGLQSALAVTLAVAAVR
jgi:prepilin signal peptidase PulO-like enzyme (type II secretory pathway)